MSTLNRRENKTKTQLSGGLLKIQLSGELLKK